MDILTHGHMNVGQALVGQQACSIVVWSSAPPVVPPPTCALRHANSARAALRVHNSTSGPLRGDFGLGQHRQMDSKQNTKLRLDEKYDRHTQPQKQTLLPIPRRYHYHNSNISAELHVCTPIIRVIGHTRKKATSGTHGHAGPQILA